MLLKGIEFENFKPFRGKQYIDLSVNPNENKNVILIGGLNNCGKTTILDAIKLVLYGDKNKELWSNQQSYEDYIRELFNKIALKEGANQFSVTLQFEKEGVQGVSNLTIERRWILGRHGGINEEFTLLEDGTVIDVDKTQEEDYIDYLIPYGVSQFFFFDGEKVQKMAEDNGYEAKLISAIHAILNISFYTDLVADLEFYEKNKTQEGMSHKPSELKRIELELTQVDENILNCKNSITQANEKIDELESHAETLKKLLRRFGVSEVQDRLQLEEEKQEFLNKRDQLLEKLKSYAKDTLPFAILYPLIKELDKRLRLEEAQEKDQIASQDLYSKYELFSELLFDDKENKPNPELTYPQKQFLKSRAFLVWDTLFPRPRQFVSEILHDLSIQERKVLYNRIKDIFNNISSGELTTIIRELEFVEERLRKIRLLEKRMPEDQTYLDKENELKETYQEIGKLKKVKSELELEISKLNDRKIGIARRLSDTQRNVQLSAIAMKKVDASKKIRIALKEFVNELTQKKSREVRYYLSKMFRALFREGEEINEFDIDPKTFEVTLVSGEGDIVTKKSLSAGVKEIYAVSLLWALAQSSNRNLPMVIDTPLARLDSIHRDNIAKIYLPQANSQVVLLSTNEEINDKLYPALKPHIVRSYILNKKSLHETVIQRGYFF